MRALLVVAHGSRREESNDEVRRLAEALRGRLGGRYQRVEAAFLELAEPSIAAGIDQAVAAGAAEVVVFPYFLTAGRHVAEDVPAIVEERRRAHPSVHITLTPYLGASEAVAALIAEQV